MENTAQNPINFYGLTLNQLQDRFRAQGKEKFRAQQLFKWVYEKRTTGYDNMSNLGKAFREELKSTIVIDLPQVVSHLKSVDGTEKFLYKMKDGLTVEAVLIPSDDRLTLCLSSEVGCNMACTFCFTGKQKLKRRLLAHEIVGQFVHVEDTLRATDRKVTNIVFMGMGEPLDNPDEVFRTVEILHEPFGRNLSRRKITISTSGLIPQMYKIAQSKTRLAVSLNGYDDASRTHVMPINKKYPLKDLLDECRRYHDQTGERITFEYVLLKGVTDQIEHARKLWKLVWNIPCKVNIIPFNEHPGSDYERPDDSQVQLFHSELMRLGAHVLLRRTMGRDIFAACGQLTSEFENKPKSMDISNSKLGGQLHV